MKKFLKSLPFRLLLGLVLGTLLGLLFGDWLPAWGHAAAGESAMKIVVSVKNIVNEIIMFLMPLLVLGFIAPSITGLGKGASRLLGVGIVLAYVSSLGGALLSTAAGYVIIPHLSIATDVAVKELPANVFALEIPQIMSTMSALVLAIMIGLGATWTKAELITKVLDEFRQIVAQLVKGVVVPLLPLHIMLTFICLGYNGTITKQFPSFLKIIFIVIVLHFVWMAILYTAAGIYSHKNPKEVFRHYPPVYLTAVGTMSSAASLSVALENAHKSSVLRKDMVDFGVPLFANIHLCGSCITEVFFCMAIGMMLQGQIPSPDKMIPFCLLLAIFSIGVTGIPGGTAMASMGIVSGILGFDSTGTALVLAVYALQDSFGTACNICGDGALTLILSAYKDRQDKKVGASATNTAPDAR